MVLSIAIVILQWMSKYISVSYTHLDVYKRQLERNPGREHDDLCL